VDADTTTSFLPPTKGPKVGNLFGDDALTLSYYHYLYYHNSYFTSTTTTTTTKYTKSRVRKLDASELSYH
jgi:hypothetical protein